MKKTANLLLWAIVGLCPLIDMAVAQERLGSAVDIEITPFSLCTISDQAIVTCDTAPISLIFTPPTNLAPVEKLTLGQNHACAIEAGGNVRCWGGNFFGQLDVPASASPAVDISAGQAHTCSVTTSGSAVCWGLTNNGRTDPPDTSTQYIAISAGSNHTCAVSTNGRLDCWGANSGRMVQFVENLPPVQGVSADQDRTCVLTDDGDILCSVEFAGRLPEPANGPYTDLSFSGGNNKGDITCALDTTGTADCVVQPPIFLFDPVNEFLAIEAREADARARRIEQAARDSGPFVSIDTATIPIRVGEGANDFAVFGCGVKADGAVACWEPPSGIDISIANDRPDFTPDVTAQIYSDTAIELLWPPVFSFRAGVGEGFYEILRDGEIFASVTSSSSFYDDSVQPDTDYLYQVRAVSASGLRGDLSPEVLVNTTNRDNPVIGGYVRPERSLEPTNLIAFVYGAQTVELVWDRTPFNVKGYEILVNGIFTAFTNGTSYFTDQLEPNTEYRFDVVAIDNDGNIGGFKSVNAILGDPLHCF